MGRRQRVTYSKVVKQKAIELCRLGMSTYEAARQLGAIFVFCRECDEYLNGSKAGWPCPECNTTLRQIASPSQSAVHKWVGASSTGRKLTKEALKKIRRWYKRKSTVQIADRLGVSPSTVYRALQKMGVKIRGRCAYKESDIDKVVGLHARGISINEIAHKHILRNGQRPDWQTVRRWLVSRGVEPKLQRK